MAQEARANYRGEFAPTQGQEEHVFQAVETAQLIEVGDWVFQHPTSRKPRAASALADQGSDLLSADVFQQYFLGVSEQRSPVGTTKKIRIATRGVKLVDCVSDDYKVGDFLMLAEQSSGTALENRKLKKTTSLTRAVAVVHEDSGAAAVKVWCKFQSTILHGGFQAQANGASSGTI